VSRKFVYQQANRARRALDDAFISAATDDTLLFQIAVTKRGLRQVIVALALMCRSSYLGIIEFMRDVLGWPISIGTVHNVLHAAAEQASVINGAQDLSRIRTGLHDELFHGGKPVGGIASAHLRAPHPCNTVACATAASATFGQSASVTSSAAVRWAVRSSARAA
jgi:hypothetical protein